MSGGAFSPYQQNIYGGKATAKSNIHNLNYQTPGLKSTIALGRTSFREPLLQNALPALCHAS
jgi:hypothetical protein